MEEIEIKPNIEQLQGLIDNSNSMDCDVILINSIRIIQSQSKQIDELKKENSIKKISISVSNRIRKRAEKENTKLKERIKELEGKVLKGVRDYPNYDTCIKCNSKINWHHDKCIDCLSDEMGL